MFKVRILPEKILPILLWVLFLPVQSCANSQIGSKSNSFESSSDNLTKDKTQLISSKEDKSLKKRIKPRPKEKNINNLTSATIKNDNKILNLDRVKKIKSKSSEKRIRSKFKDRKSYPYRLIIKLSGVNPKDPIGEFSEALRNSGIEFEVEKLEILSTNSDQNLR